MAASKIVVVFGPGKVKTFKSNYTFISLIVIYHYTNNYAFPKKINNQNMNDKKGFFENIERVINTNKSNSLNVTSQKQIDHSVYWKIGIK